MLQTLSYRHLFYCNDTLFGYSRIHAALYITKNCLHSYRKLLVSYNFLKHEYNLSKALKEVTLIIFLLLINIIYKFPSLKIF